MGKALKMWSRIALVCAIACMASVAALARSGGGGNDPGSTAPPLIFDYTMPVNGVTPSWSGDSVVTNSIPGYYSYAILSLNIKTKPVSLPDNSVLLVTAYTSNLVTGQSLPPVAVTSMIVLSKTATLKSKTVIYNATFDQIVRQLDRVVITTLDGTVIATCHP